MLTLVRTRSAIAVRALAAVSLLALAAGCASFPQLRAPVNESGQGAPTVVERAQAAIGAERSDQRIQRLPSSRPLQAPPPPAARITGEAARALVGEGTVQATLPPQTLPEFARAAFQDVLGLTVGLGPGVATRRDVVALASPASASRVDFFLALQETLARYGVQVLVDGRFVMLTDAQGGGGGGDIVFASGRGLQASQGDMRPATLLFTLQALEAGPLAQLISGIGERPASVQVQPNPNENTIVLSGPAGDVEIVARLLREIDQPRYIDSRIARVSPIFMTADRLAGALDNALRSEGILSTTGAFPPRAVNLVALSPSNQLLVFARDEAIFERVLQWVEILDSPSNVGDAQAVYVYEVRNLSVSTLAAQLGVPVAGSASSGGSVAAAGGAAAPTGARQPGQPGAGPSIAGQITADQAGNRLIFQGTASEYERLLQLMALFDRPVPQVMIEVMIAEITLTDLTRFGVEWSAAGQRSDERFDGGTIGGLGLGTTGLRLAITADAARALVNAFASNNKVNILSTPRLIAQSGGQASIQVGTDVPVITSQRAQNTTTGGGSASDVLQSVEYRRTGVILTVKPVVFGDGQVDIEITQEVSSSTGSASDAIPSPLITNRSVATRMTIRDGMTGVIGGLIQDSFSKSNSGVPVLKDVPVVGAAFRTDRVDGTKTELLLLVTPRVMRDADAVAAVSDTLTKGLNRTLRLARGGSYTLTPLSTGVSIGGGRAAQFRPMAPVAPAPAPPAITPDANEDAPRRIAPQEDVPAPRGD